MEELVQLFLLATSAWAALSTATSHVLGVVGSVPAREPCEYVVPILGDGVSEGVSDLQVLMGKRLATLLTQA